jgi:hypothetical protein
MKATGTVPHRIFRDMRALLQDAGVDFYTAAAHAQLRTLHLHGRSCNRPWHHQQVNQRSVIMKTSSVLAVCFLVLVSSTGLANGPAVVQGALSGFNEVPALSTTGHGAFFARIDSAAEEIEYELSYDAIEGDVTQSHIHVGQPDVNGSISVFLCSNLGNGPAGTQACPASPGVISGTITAADVIGPTAQGVEAGAFDELVQAIRAGATYVNVHSTLFPGGEVRSGLAPHH